MNQAVFDKVHRSKVETLLGERGVKADHAVRFRDLQNLNIVGGMDEAAIRALVIEVATAVAREVAER